MVMNAVNYLYHIIMGRVLGPVDYGTLSSLYSILYLVGIVPTSTSVAIVKFISSVKNDTEVYSIYKALERFILRLSLALSLILLITTPLISNFLQIKDVWSVASVSLILFLILILLLNQATSQGLLKFMGSVGPGLISSVVKLGLGLLLVILGWSVLGAMVGVIFGMFFAYLYSYFFLKKNMQETKIKPFHLGPFFKFALPSLLQALAFTSFFTVDVILAKHFLSPFEAGIYGALSTLGKIIFFAVSPIISTMFPIISGRASRQEEYGNILGLSLLAVVFLGGTVVFLYYLFPELAIGILYGKAYLVATSELFLMGLFVLFYSLSYFWVNFFLSVGDTKIIWVPLAVALVQIPALWKFHQNIREVVTVNLWLGVLLFLVIIGYVGYNSLKIKYGKR